MVGGSLRVLRLLPSTITGRHDIAEGGVKHKKSINQSQVVEIQLPYDHDDDSPLAVVVIYIDWFNPNTMTSNTKLRMKTTEM